MDSTMILEIWDMLRSYIPTKEKYNAAEQFVRYLQDQEVSKAVLLELRENCEYVDEVLSDLESEYLDDELYYDDDED